LFAILENSKLQRLAACLLLVVLASAAGAPYVWANPSGNQLKKSNIGYTGTYLTKSKVSTHGYEKEVVSQPSFLVRRLPDGRLRFLAQSQGGGIHNDHVAYLDGIVKLKRNGTARFRYGRCVVDIQFRPGAVVVKDSGDCTDCGFGEGAGIDGTYFLVSNKPPDFEKSAEPGEDPIESQE
jgi:hypothetical protein